MMSDLGVDAVVSLDSLMSSEFGLELSQFEASPNYEAARSSSSVPILNIYQEEVDIVAHDLSFIESFKHADRYQIKMNKLQHFNLTSLGMIASLIPGLSAMPKLLVGGEDAELGHELMCRYTLRFLQAYLRNSQRSLQFLAQKPDLPGVPAGFLTHQLSRTK